MNKTKLFRSKTFFIILTVVICAAGVGFTLYRLNRSNTALDEENASQLETTQVRRGDIILTATGSGTLIPGSEVNLSFSTTGTVAAIHVETGDKVSEGDLLAELDDIESLQAEMVTKELELLTAQKELQEPYESAGANLAEAQLTLAEAKDAYQDAKSGLKLEGMERCDEETVAAYYDEYIVLEEQLEDLGEDTSDTNYYLTVIAPLKSQRDEAYAAYLYCAGFTNYEIEESQANLTITEAELEEAEEYLALLQVNDGLDPDEVALAENNVSSAEVALALAQKDLEGATLTASMNGTVMEIQGNVGDTVGTSTFITLADLNHPQVEFYIDETDIEKVATGYEAQIVFDALPDQSFSGKVVQIEPSLVEVSGYNVLQGRIDLDTDMQGVKTLPEGLAASVDIHGGSAEDALLIPVEALRDLGDGEYGVYVLNDQDEPELRMVNVGLMDYTYAEITSGLAMGDIVTTGIMETN